MKFVIGETQAETYYDEVLLPSSMRIADLLALAFELAQFTGMPIGRPQPPVTFAGQKIDNAESEVLE